MGSQNDINRQLPDMSGWLHRGVGGHLISALLGTCVLPPLDGPQGDFARWIEAQAER
jgi:hypothetical protein